MAENITKIKVGDDVRCISLDTEVINTATLGHDDSGRHCVKLGSSLYADEDSNGIGVKIHPDTVNYLQPEHYGLSLKLDTMAKDMTDAVGKKLGLAIDGYNNLVIGTQPLKLGKGLIRNEGDKGLALNLGSGLEFDDKEGHATPSVAVKLLVGQVLQFTSDGELSVNYETLARILESNYGFVRNK